MALPVCDIYTYLEGDALVDAVVVHVVVCVDAVRVEVALGAEAAAGPVEVVLAGQVGVHVPLVVLGVVLREEERDYVQGDTSRCFKHPDDIKIKVWFWPGLT